MEGGGELDDGNRIALVAQGHSGKNFENDKRQDEAGVKTVFVGNTFERPKLIEFHLGSRSFTEGKQHVNSCLSLHIEASECLSNSLSCWHGN
jgi:hypothetical protein